MKVWPYVHSLVEWSWRGVSCSRPRCDWMKLGNLRSLRGTFISHLCWKFRITIISSLKACLCVFDIDNLEWAPCSFLGIYRDFNLFGMKMGVLLRCLTCRYQDVLKMSWEAFSVQALEWPRMLTSLVLMTVAVTWLWIRLVSLLGSSGLLELKG
jgi:hypothetical protein